MPGAGVCAPRSTSWSNRRGVDRRRRCQYLDPAAPGGHHPGDVDVQLALDDALACGDAAALTRLPTRVVGRVPFQVLAGLAEPAPRSAKELYRGAPYGVGYFAGVWQP